MSFFRPSLDLASETAKLNPALLKPLGRVLRGSVSGEQVSEGEMAIKNYLTSQALWAANLTVELIKGDEDSPFDKLNPAVLNSCNALVFINASKGGLALSFASGYGFVIKKLSQDQYGGSSWGQPLFFTMSQAGIGLTAGYQRSRSVIAVLAMGSMDVFKNGTTSLGSDLGLFSTDGALTGMTGASLGGSKHMGMTVDTDRSAFCYSKVDGVYLELSFHGSSISPDRESNEALYGKDYDPDAILNNADMYRPEMMSLLETINRHGRLAMSTSSSFTA